MTALLVSTVFRGMMGFVQVMVIAVVVAVAQQRSQSGPDVTPEGICSSSQADFAEEASYLVDNEAVMKRMMLNMAVRPTGDIDRDFVLMMSPHHQGAIDLARVVLRYGRNEQIRRLAQEIIVTQQQEIAAMRLAVGYPLPPSIPAPTQIANVSGEA
jgi:uncharacterized protein (DUF305 family)